MVPLGVDGNPGTPVSIVRRGQKRNDIWYRRGGTQGWPRPPQSKCLLILSIAFVRLKAAEEKAKRAWECEVFYKLFFVFWGLFVSFFFERETETA